MKRFQRGQRVHNSTLRRRALRELPQKCRCGLGPWWQGKYLPMHLHHKHGFHTSVDLDDYEWLCPNCHSQDSTTAVNRDKRPSIELNEKTINELINWYKELGSIRDALFKMGFRQNSTRASNVLSAEIDRRKLPKKNGKYSICSQWDECSDEGRAVWTSWLKGGLTRTPSNRTIDSFFSKYTS